MEGKTEVKNVKMQNHVTITKRQNAAILWRYQSLLISIGKGKPSGTTGSIKTITNKMAVLILS